MVAAKTEGKEVFFSSDESKALRNKLIAGTSFDALTGKERLLAVELARAEAIRWRNSNHAAGERREREVNLKKAITTDPELRKLLEAKGIKFGS